MPPFPPGQLSSAELASIESWLKSQCAADPADTWSADLYASNCARCHGADGAGTSNVSGLQGPEVRCRSRELLLSEMSGAEGGMPDFSDLSDAQAQAITTYTRGLCPGTPPN
jgi:mono/diheme cytochrome c family protein